MDMNMDILAPFSCASDVAVADHYAHLQIIFTGTCLLNSVSYIHIDSSTWDSCGLAVAQRPRQQAKLKPSYYPQQTWPPPTLRLLTSTKWCHATGLLAAIFVGEDLLTNRRLQTLLLFWLDVRSLENLFMVESDFCDCMLVVCWYREAWRTWATLTASLRRRNQRWQYRTTPLRSQTSTSESLPTLILSLTGGSRDLRRWS